MSPESRLLAQFHLAQGGIVSPENLQEVIADTNRPLAAWLGELSGLGYVFEQHPHQGYRLTRSTDRLLADDIQAQLDSKVIGREILVFESTSSTSDAVERMARAGKAEGLVVFAETQTKGRGRQGRAWSSPKGKGLWFSVLLRPRLLAADYSRLTVMASVAVAHALRGCCRLEPQIKWPNDILANGRKLAGILTESRGGIAILGIGVDVNCREMDFPFELQSQATSVATVTGQVQDRNRLAASILAELDRLYARVETDFESITDEWARLCVTLGKQVTVKQGQQTLEGLALALDGSGALLLRRDNGRIVQVTAGDLEVHA